MMMSALLIKSRPLYLISHPMDHRAPSLAHDNIVPRFIEWMSNTMNTVSATRMAMLSHHLVPVVISSSERQIV